ncbi:3782_t:CDS:2 [Paraglomus brasilianum]|uniref:3782_t:CDS:1 n=1 Tax=Paraglomus brasilianum TaxID=144538 RepID=A0A9N9BD82_9GLOM|nr:3782_t:CDS:2 [Paraglomus brasilianum]
MKAFTSLESRIEGNSAEEDGKKSDGLEKLERVEPEIYYSRPLPQEGLYPITRPPASCRGKSVTHRDETLWPPPLIKLISSTNIGRLAQFGPLYGIVRFRLRFRSSYEHQRETHCM